jgi:pimeloyl-[acyl-carrier protein] synthase
MPSRPGPFTVIRMADPLVYDPFQPELREDPYPTYHALRRADPVHVSPFLDVVVLTRYADVDLVLRDRRFSADRRLWDWFPPMEGYEPSMGSLDPPDHTRLRRLVGGPFTARLVESARPWARSMVNDVLDRAEQQGGLELVEGLAYPMAMTVFNHALGLPQADTQRFREWTGRLVRLLDPLALQDDGMGPAFRAVEDEVMTYLAGVVADRRREPRDDLISALIAADQDGDVLSERELVLTLEILLIAGYETTTRLIGNGVLALLRHPGQLALLRDRPGLIGSAVEELLRWDAPAQLTLRVAREDCELGGRPVRRGQAVAGLVGAANRDPEQFPDPDRLDLARSPNPHLSFGRGVHFCLGAPLARMDAQLTMGELVRRFPRLRLSGEPVRSQTITLRGLTSLPLDVS